MNTDKLREEFDSWWDAPTTNRRLTDICKEQAWYIFQAAQATQPDGHKLVPIEPTMQMKNDAAFNLCNEFDHGEVEFSEDLCLAAYRELVDAAPEVQS